MRTAGFFVEAMLSNPAGWFTTMPARSVRCQWPCYGLHTHAGLPKATGACLVHRTTRHRVRRFFYDRIPFHHSPAAHDAIRLSLFLDWPPIAGQIALLER